MIRCCTVSSHEPGVGATPHLLVLMVADGCQGKQSNQTSPQSRESHFGPRKGIVGRRPAAPVIRFI